MKPDPRWRSAPPEFWHYVRVLSEKLRYSRKGKVHAHDEQAITSGLKAMDLDVDPLLSAQASSVSMRDLVDYFKFRADLIEGPIRKNLQTPTEARALFDETVDRHTTKYESTFNKSGAENGRKYRLKNGSTAVVPYNKQKKDKRDLDFLTGTTNILIAHYLDGAEFDQNPVSLPAFTEDRVVIGSMSRRLDGAFPSTVNPVALWEFKCYYYTTSFGSKISDAVYIADLDGYDRSNAEKATAMPINLTLFIDAYSAWMEQGKSYICRAVDLLQRGAVDNLVVGREVIEAVPQLVPEWVEALSKREESR